MTFGYGIPYYQIVFKFMFWLINFIGGLGLIKTSRMGIVLGLVSVTFSGVLCFVYSITLTSKHLNLSRFIFVNQTRREMTNLEKLEIIYLQPVKYWILFGVIVLTFVIIRRQLRTPNE